MTRFRADSVLAQLKDFQRRTAAHTFERLFVDPDSTHRFLVADEVGLGKTLVARGVIAKAREHLQDTVERIDVIYVCSNAQIAKQNVRRLHVGDDEHFEVADRITMLPITAQQLSSNPFNVVSFTPGTSFELQGGGGKARERAVLRLMLREVWGASVVKGRGSFRVFQGGVQSLDRFRALCTRVADESGRKLDRSLVKSFGRVLDDHDASADDPLKDRFAELCDVFRNERPVSGFTRQQKRDRNWFVGELRDLLARACLEALQPDLIILDEFQRFKHLLAPPDAEKPSPAAELARELFNYVDTDAQSHARVLLLSATPYKMLTTVGEDEDHHADLIDTADFLFGHDADQTAELRDGLRSLRRGLMQAGRDGGAAAKAGRDRVQQSLRRVMVRTERLAATADRSGMLSEVEADGLGLEVDEILQYASSARLARKLGVPDPLEYWKSAPYLLNFMDEYKMKSAFEEAVADNGGVSAADLDGGTLLPWPRIRDFGSVTPANARLRWLRDDTIGRGAWRLLWLPPSLPYLEPSGPFADPDLSTFTKRLIFSSWTIVPKTVATMITYEAERAMVTMEGEPRYRNESAERSSRARLLDFRVSAGRLSGMPVFGMLYPSVALARAGDPLALCRDEGGPVHPARAASIVAERLNPHIRRAVEDAQDSLGRTLDSGRADERWYWLAPLLLDWLDDAECVDDFWTSSKDVAEAFTGGAATSVGDLFLDHVRHAYGSYKEYPEDLGAPPEDLPLVLARMALTAPGPVALRALARASGRDVTDLGLRDAACRIAWSLRSLFNGPEVIELVRSLYPGEPYWQRVLDYCLAGNLQAVLDEYAHVLVPALGYLDASSDEAIDGLAKAMNETITLRTVNYGVSEITSDGEGVSIAPGRMRANFALRLSDERSDDGTKTRLSEVRDAFNSPFWPFVLASTSAGQEGLDFHSYCHAVVHWNLPSNPVDLEQREGRVHRFKGHAVRKNIAADFGSIGLAATGDPWEAMFEAAHEARPAGVTEIVPYWVYCRDGGAKIERYVPALPMSRDRARAEALKRAVASYRLAFGQARQEDLLAYLAGEVGPEELERLADELRIDLSPS